MFKKVSIFNGVHNKIFIRQPEWFIVEGKEHLVCHLAIDSHLKKIKFVQTDGDPCLCVLRDKGETLSYLAMYVDNILIASKTDKKITKF